MRDLVASAVGFSDARNDQITIKSLEFQSVEPMGTLAEAPASGLPIDLTTLAELAAFSVVALVLGLFVVRPALTARAPAAPPGLPSPSDDSRAPAARDREADAGLPALTGTIDDGPPMEFGMPLEMADAMGGGFGGLSGDPDDPVARLRQLIADRRDETVEILRNWMEEAEDTA